MPNPVKIIVNAQVEEAAAALRKFVAEGASQIDILGQSAQQAGAHFAGMSYYFRSGIDSIRYAAAGGGDRAAFYAVDELVRGLVSSGMAISRLVPILAAGGLAVGAFSLAMHFAKGDEEEVIQKTNELNEVLKKIPETLSLINSAMQNGIIPTNAGADLIQKLQLGINALPNINNPYGSPEPLIDFKKSSQQVNEELVKMGVLLENVNEKTKEKTFSINPQYEALLQVQKLQKQVQLEGLEGNERARAEAKQRYDEQIELIKRIEQTADTMPFKQTAVQKQLLAMLPDLKKSVESGYAGELGGIDQKEQERMAREQSQSMARIKTEDAKEAADQIKQLEDSITENQLANGDERNKDFQKEYQQRISLYQNLLYSGTISEDEYRDKSIAAAKQRAQAEKEFNSELERQIQLKQEIIRGQLEAQLSSIQGNPFLSEQEKASQTVSIYQQLIEANQARIVQLQQVRGDQSAELDAQKQIVELTREQADLENKMAAAKGQSSFTYQWGTVIAQIQTANNLAKETAQTFQNVFNAAISSISHNLTGVIMGTERWGQALRNIAFDIMSQIIEAIIQMGVRWLLTQAVMAMGGRAILAAAVAASAPIAAIQAAIWTPAATMATIGTLGAAAIAAPGFIGMAETIALGEAVLGGGFAEGGRPPMGKISIVGEEGPEFFVPDSAGTIIPADQTAAMMSSRPRSGVGGVAGGDPDIKIDHIVVNNEQELFEKLKTSTAKRIIVSHLFDPGARMRAGIAT